MGEDYFIGLGIAQIVCGLTTIGTQVHNKDNLKLDFKVIHQNVASNFSFWSVRK